MILKIVPYILIIIPVISFFISPEKLGNPTNPNMISNLVLLIFSMPWWGKVLSILIGIFWIGANNETNNQQPKDGAGLR